MTELALTLPKAATRRHVRRKPRPPKDPMMIALVVMWAAFAIQEYLEGRIAVAAVDAVVSGLLWRVWHLRTGGDREGALRVELVAIAAVVASALVDIA